MRSIFPSASTSLLVRPVALFLLVLILSGCGGGDGTTPAKPPAATESITLNIPVTQTIAAGKSIALSASTTSGGTPTWTLAAGNPGSLSASSGVSVNYVPPSAVKAITAVTVTATSGNVSKSTTLMLYSDPGTPALSLIAGGAVLPEAVPQDGPGATATFLHIVDFTGDGAGNFFVADEGATRQYIRKVSASGAVTTLFSSSFGDTDGDSAHAQLNHIESLSVAADGSVIVLETGVSHLRRIAADNSVTTLFSNIDLNGSQALVAPDGTFYVREQQLIEQLNPAGELSTLAGRQSISESDQDGQGTAALFSQVGELALGPDGNLYAAGGIIVRKITPGGAVTTVAGVKMPGTNSNVDIDGPVASARFADSIGSIAFDAAGNMLLSESHSVRMISPALQVSTLSTSIPGNPNSRLRISGSNTVLSTTFTELRVLNADGSTSAFAGQPASTAPVIIDGQGAAARFTLPQMLAATPDGTVYVLDQVNVSQPAQYQLRTISPAGLVGTLAAPLQLNPVNPNHSAVSAIVADHAGAVYLIETPYATTESIDQIGGAVFKLGADGKPVLLAGVPSRERNAGETYDLADGSGGAVHFNYPVFAGFDTDNNLYLSDRSRVSGATAPVYRKMTPQGAVTTIAALPAGLNAAADGNTDVYGADAGQQVVFRVTAAGVRTVAAGVPNQAGDQLGALPGLLTSPRGLAQMGPYTYALISGNRVVKLVVPH